jgi:hypothetical protein
MMTPVGRVLVGLLACLAGGATAPPEKPKNTPGMSLSYEEKSRRAVDGMDMVEYALKTEGFPKDQVYALYGQWMDGSSKELLREIRLDETGYVREPDGDEFTLALGRMFLGEVAVFALVSKDKASQAFVEITPFPIQAEGVGGCRLFVRPMDVSGRMFLITGSGFQPNKKLKIIGVSVEEVAHMTSDGKPDGSLKHVILPAVVGRKGGDASFEASDSACSVKVQYKWGNEMRKASPAPPATP